MVGLKNGQHNFLHEELSTWVCKLLLPSHFLLSQWTCFYVKKIIDVQSTQIKKCTLCDTTPCPFDVSSSSYLKLERVFACNLAHPKDLVLYVCKRYANILVVESF